MASAGRSAVVAVLWLSAAVARADGGWPAVSPEWLERGPGGGLALLPLLCWWALAAAWAASSSWAHHDATLLKLRPDYWTAVVVAPFVVASLLAWLIPWSAAGLALMALAWILPLYIYSLQRNPKVPESVRIFTRGHLMRAVRGLLGRVGFKVGKEEEAADTGLPVLTLVSTSGADAAENKSRQDEAVKMPGFPAAVKLLQEAVVARATTAVIDAGSDGVRVKYEVDGLAAPARAVTTPAKGLGKSKQPAKWGDAAPLDAAIGASAVAVLRTIAGGDPKRESREPAAFSIDVDGKKKACTLATRSSKTAKQVVLTVETPPFTPKTLEDLGMPADVAGRVRELMTLENGIFLVSSPPLSGSSTAFETVLLAADRLVRDFVSIENADAPPKEVPNVKPFRYSVAAGDPPVSALKKAMLEYPKAVVARDLADADLAAELVKLADEHTMVVVSIRAADAIEAIEKVLALGIAREQLAHCLLGSLSVRLVRKLCPHCAESLATPPELLQRLKKTAEELPEIKRTSPDGGCPRCAGRQFIGRTAVFELAAGATLRKYVAHPKSDAKVLRQAAAKDGLQSFRDVGMDLVAAGTTSLDELQRVFSAGVKKEAGPAGVKR
jgi:type II secretory ATPase GspE/PulE/Tfp pilus assembly ATPase PilB-like protein